MTTYARWALLYTVRENARRRIKLNDAEQDEANERASAAATGGHLPIDDHDCDPEDDDLDTIYAY